MCTNAPALLLLLLVVSSVVCGVVLGALLLNLLLALDHDHGQEGEDDSQSKDQKHTGDADRIFTARKVIVQEVRLVDKGLHY